MGSDDQLIDSHDLQKAEDDHERTYRNGKEKPEEESCNRYIYIYIYIYIWWVLELICCSFGFLLTVDNRNGTWIW
jgi:hypothetical protein